MNSSQGNVAKGLLGYFNLKKTDMVYIFGGVFGRAVGIFGKAVNLDFCLYILIG